MAPLTITIRQEGEIHIIELLGTLEYESVPSVADSVKKILEQGANYLLIDMTGVTHANSKGLGAMLSIRNNCERHHAKFVVWNVHHPARSVFHITLLEKVLPMHDGTIEEAKKFLIG